MHTCEFKCFPRKDNPGIWMNTVSFRTCCFNLANLRKKENKIRICSKQEENRMDKTHATKHLVLAIASSETNYLIG